MLIGGKKYCHLLLSMHMESYISTFRRSWVALCMVLCDTGIGAAALACTMLATLFACYKELGEQPASLMRPPAPKIGKRVFLEHVTFYMETSEFYMEIHSA